MTRAARVILVAGGLAVAALVLWLLASVARSPRPTQPAADSAGTVATRTGSGTAPRERVMEAAPAAKPDAGSASSTVAVAPDATPRRDHRGEPATGTRSPLTADTLASLYAPAAAAVKRCAAAHPTVRGAIDLTVDAAVEQGRVRVRGAESVLREAGLVVVGAPLAECVAAALRGLEFDAPAGQPDGARPATFHFAPP